MFTFLATVFIIICILLILVVLLQKGRGGGLGAAFGGAGSSAFGTRTGDVLTWVTVILVTVFLVLTAVLAVVVVPPPSRVPKPTFVPAPGAIEETRWVTIQCAAGKAKIFYTLDGSEPTQQSLLYDGTSVPVQPDETLKAKAFLRGRIPSATRRGDYPHTSRAKTQPSTTASAPAISTAPAR